MSWANRRRYVWRIGVWCWGPIIVLIMTWPIWSGRDRLAFRDVGYFYTPLYAHVAQLSGNWPWLQPPIWNSLDQTGLPLAGETTTAVYYPVRVAVYALDRSAESQMAWYVIVHLILASVFATVLARRQRFGRIGACAASVVYPLSGGVLFLATNPTFLVGAAWLPLVLAALLPLRSITIGWAMTGAVALAMMVLGGDPQLALLSLVTVTVVTLLAPVSIPTKCWRLSQVAAVGIIAVFLAISQIAASIDWARQSQRIASGGSTNAFAFSLSPWRIAELAAPNLFGCPWPINTRWDRALFADGRSDPADALWTPTLYAGALPVVGLGLAFWRGYVRNRRRQCRPMWVWFCVFALSMLGAMGAYGPMYFVQSITGWGQGFSSAALGPTWWLHEYLPGYASFRYPSKWLPLAMMAMALFAAQATRLRLRRTVQLWGCFLVVGVIAVGFIGVPSLLTHAGDSLAQRGIFIKDPFWGPVQWGLVHANWRFSWIHASMAVLAALLLVGVRDRRAAKYGILLLITADLVVAHHDLVPRIDRVEESRVIAARDEKTPSLRARWIRTSGLTRWPNTWSNVADGKRLMDVESTLRATWFGRWHLENDQAVFNSMTSIESAAMRSFWQNSRRQLLDLDDDQHADYWHRQRQRVGIAGRIEPKSRRDDEPIGTAAGQLFARWTRDESDGEQAVDRVDQVRVSAIGDGSIELLESSGNTQRIRVNTMKPARLIRNVYQDGHWIVSRRPIDSGATSIIDAPMPYDAGLLQAVDVPPGSWQLEFRYQPWWHRPCMWLATITWIGVAIALGATSPVIRSALTNWKPAIHPN
ncbi:MAG: hypothetical protein AAGJ40_16060 [Planctomycetota bacterium]